MYQGECHCGNVRFTVTAAPAQLVDCNCSLCRRLGALWGHVPIESVTVEASSEATLSYIQGDKTLDLKTCKNCGCTTHYENLDSSVRDYMGVNFRMCSDEVISKFKIRRLDGADTWKFLD